MCWTCTPLPRLSLPEVGEPTGPDVVVDMIKFDFSDDAVIQFTRGDCWYLAWELHRIGGFPLRFVCYGGDPHYDWCHVVVEVGPDQYMDVLGIMSAEEIESYWCATHLTPPVDGIDLDWETYHQWIRDCAGGGSNRYFPTHGRTVINPTEMALDVMDEYAYARSLAA